MTILLMKFPLPSDDSHYLQALFFRRRPGLALTAPFT
jgi:hypothetical protein